jgi:hypothetical protein
MRPEYDVHVVVALMPLLLHREEFSGARPRVAMAAQKKTKSLVRKHLRCAQISSRNLNPRRRKHYFPPSSRLAILATRHFGDPMMIDPDH